MSKNFTNVMKRKKMISSTYGVPANKQKGVVLIVGLIMVLLMTIVGLAAIKGSGLQENMATNMRDVNITFQAAESALKNCEGLVDFFTVATVPEFNNEDGLFTDRQALSPPEPVASWDNDDWLEDGRLTEMGLTFVSAQPRCVVEQLEYPVGAFSDSGDGVDKGSMSMGEPQLFRVTSLAWGYTEDTRVVLQSTYKRRYQ